MFPWMPNFPWKLFKSISMNRVTETDAPTPERWPLDYGGPVDRPFEPFPHAALEKSIVDRFEATARRYAARTAVADTVRRLTYAELAHLVARIAAATVQAVDDRPDPVVILLPRDIYFPAAMLGALAAGRGCVPLDASNPIERNRLIAIQSGAAAVISAGHLARLVRTLFAQHLPIVDIDAIGDIATPTPVARRVPDDLAFIIYTSGSTGHPKGTYHSHRNLLHDVLTLTNTLHLNQDDRVALLKSPAVNGGIRETFMALLNGATLHILPPTELLPHRLVQEFQTRDITIFRTVPVLLRRITEALVPDRRLDSVRVVGLASDRVEWSDYDLFHCHFSSRAFLSVSCGSTESGGDFCHWFVSAGLRTSGDRLPIGRVLPGARVTIETDDRHRVGVGEIGEFVLASRYVALGYWREPALTAQAFATDPADPATRVFRTGDLGRMRHDGLLEFVGRKDQMIKLRGHRIELGEIELALRSCAGVEDAAVVVRRNEAGLPRSLAAYVEPKRDVGHLTPRDLVAVLRTCLPGYMIPATIVVVDDLPRLPTIKIDREELRRRDQREPERRLTAPTSQIEVVRTKTAELLLELWCEVLDRQDIGYDDDFFLCGGDSVSAFDLMLRIENEFQYQAPLIVLAEAPTVSQFAHHLERMMPGAINNKIPIHTHGRRRPLFAVYNDGGHALALLPILRSLGPDQPFYWLQPPGIDWTSTKCASLPQIVTCCINEAKTVQPHGPYRLVGTGFGGLVAFEMALQLQETGEPVEYLAMLDTDAPTCVFGDRVDVCDSRELLRTLNAQPAPVSRFEAETRNIVEAQIRIKRDYVLDSKSARNIFRGELTFFHSTGKPVIADQDRRRLWRSFASGLRLLPVPGRTGTHDREPQYTAVRNLLEACLNDKPVTGCDPGSVYDRHYRMDDRHQPRNILGSMGDAYRIDQERIQGSVDEIRINADGIQVMGWAVGPCRRQPGQTIAVFLDDQFLGYGASSEPRPDVAKYLGADSALFCGFNFIFEPL
jgi:amino acid adenylation domain-containing protein